MRTTLLITSMTFLNAIALDSFTVQGATFTLTDQNSSLEIDTSDQATGYDWIVEGVDHLTELSNWYRVGSGGPEESVHKLSLGSQTLSDRHGDSGMDTLTVEYFDQSNRFAIEIDYSIFGNPVGSGASAIDEEIRITNLQPTPLEFHMFEYLNLDLDSSPGDDIVQVTTQNTLIQFDPQTTSSWGYDVDRYELETTGSGNSTLSKLLDPFPSDLSHFWPNGVGPFGADDVTFAFQWDFEGTSLPRTEIAPSDTVTIYKTGMLQMNLVPEPTSALFLVGAGTPAMLRRRRRRRS